MDHPGVGVRCLYELRAEFDARWRKIKSIELGAFVTFADCEIKQQLLQRNGRPQKSFFFRCPAGVRWPPFGIVDQIQIGIGRTIRQGKRRP